MTDTFTIEDLDRIFDRIPASNPRLTRDELKDRLTKIKWQPEVGQVVRALTDGSASTHLHQWRNGDEYCPFETVRPLTPKEAGYQWAIEALKRIANTWGNSRIDADAMKNLANQSLSYHGLNTVMVRDEARDINEFTGIKI